MKHDFKTLLLNIAAGILTYYVTKFLDSNNQYLFSYLVIGLYVLFILAAIYSHFQNIPKPQRDTFENHGKNKIKKRVQNNKPEVFHKILQSVVKLASQHAESSPKIIGGLINETPQIVLAYLREMEAESIVVFANGGKTPDIN